jgi:hypothetical protein
MFCYRVPPPKESITESGESPLVDEHSGSARICYSSCVMRGRIVVIAAGNGDLRRRPVYSPQGLSQEKKPQSWPFLPGIDLAVGAHRSGFLILPNRLGVGGPPGHLVLRHFASKSNWLSAFPSKWILPPGAHRRTMVLTISSRYAKGQND